jgi:hypothetical protein
VRCAPRGLTNDYLFKLTVKKSYFAACLSFA